MTEPFDWAGLWHSARELAGDGPFLMHDTAAAYLRERIEAAFVPRATVDMLCESSLANHARAEAAEAENAKLREALQWFVDNLRVREEDGTGTQYGRSSLWEGPIGSELCVGMASNSYSLASHNSIAGALEHARAALGGEHDK